MEQDWLSEKLLLLVFGVNIHPAMSLFEFIFDDLDVGVLSHTMKDAKKIYEIAGMSLPKGLRVASPRPSASIGDVDGSEVAAVSGSVTPTVVVDIPSNSEQLSPSRPTQLVDESTDEDDEEMENNQGNNGLDSEDAHNLGSEYLPDDRLDGRDMMSGKRPPPITFTDKDEVLPVTKRPTTGPLVRGFADTQSPFRVSAFAVHAATTRASSTFGDFGVTHSAGDKLDLLVSTKESGNRNISLLINDADASIIRLITDYVLAKKRISNDFDQLKEQCEKLRLQLVGEQVAKARLETDLRDMTGKHDVLLTTLAEEKKEKDAMETRLSDESLKCVEMSKHLDQSHADLTLERETVTSLRADLDTSRRDKKTLLGAFLYCSGTYLIIPMSCPS